MGIPSYFSYIIKNYSNIIRNFEEYTSTSFHHFYLDCNSIIYDSYYFLSSTIDADSFDKDGFEDELILLVIDKIKLYIQMINPLDTVYIAFDGVSPFAKMDQQRTRRYKSNDLLGKLPKITWSTLLITPGTSFMNKLSVCVENEFLNKKNNYKMFVSGTNNIGEGEHKLFQHIRSNKETIIEENVIVYGLDSDLIMLSIFHLNLCNNIFILRESPEFGIEYKDRKNKFSILDIGSFSNSIISEMGCKFSEKSRIYDYAFMCFFLGNDFLPHFPALNIRTHGIQVLLDLYRLYLGKYPDRHFISPETNTIQWRWVRLFVGELAKREHNLLLKEYFVRDKWDTYKWLDNTDEEREKILASIPVIYRAEEKYICPSERFWESRYYKVLFGNEINRKDVCVNYLEGLEWVFKYYTCECPDWKWKYNYHYPPLFSDLANFVSHKQIEYFSEKNTRTAFSPEIQLFYVLPLGKMNPSFINNNLREHFEENGEFYPVQKIKYKWSFCRYFWESHIELPEIPLTLLENWEGKNNI